MTSTVSFRQTVIRVRRISHKNADDQCKSIKHIEQWISWFYVFFMWMKQHAGQLIKSLDKHRTKTSRKLVFFSRDSKPEAGTQNRTRNWKAVEECFAHGASPLDISTIRWRKFHSLHTTAGLLLLSNGRVHKFDKISHHTKAAINESSSITAREVKRWQYSSVLTAGKSLHSFIPNNW